MITKRLNAFEVKIKEKQLDLYRQQEEQRNKDKAAGKKLDYSYQSPYDEELHRLRKIISNNDNLIDNFNKINVQLSNYPCLIIQGEAGSGKSHLLGDIATDSVKKQKPVLLLLGQLFKANKLVWENILHQLGLSCTKEELLLSLNNIGKQQGSRALILIDALNEGAGKDLWFDELAGFLRNILEYPFIGIVLTIRSTYYDDIVTPQISKKEEITQLTHEGFKGNEYEALRLFCEYHNLPQPKFPLLAPEFTNPLFLKLTCIGVKQSPEKVFPQGFQGMRVLFGYYIEAMNDKFKKKRTEYRQQTKLINKAIGEIAKACFEKEGTRALLLNEAEVLFGEKFSKCPQLLDDLILESILIRNKIQNYKTDEFEEVIYFSYERFGDFFIAEELLKNYDGKTIKEGFSEGKELGLLVESSWRNNGILTALAILLPEKYNLELFEVFDWVYKKDPDNDHFYIDTSLNHYLLDSLKWRTVKSINNDKMTEWINSEYFDVDQDSYLYKIIELTTVKGHPFNSDRLNCFLKQFTMPERDAFWQKYLRGFTGKEDNGSAYPLRRLIDWAWQPGISNSLDTETARLTGQTLAWLLSSTNRTLRDQTTKAMVNLLEEQADALTAILENFRDVDDLYIVERLYAVAYGCALRTSKENSLQKIAQYVFDNVFSKRKPPNHILLRDYARNTVEYALYKKMPLTGKMSLIRPPYMSKMPIYFPNQEEIKAFVMDHNSSGYHRNYGSQNNGIYYSVTRGDFGDKIDSSLSDFSATSFIAEKKCRAFYKVINSKQRDIIKIVVSIYTTVAMLTNKTKRVYDEEKIFLEGLLVDKKENLSQTLKLFRAELGTKKYNFFEKVFLPFIYGVQKMKDRPRNAFDIDSTKRWIIKRAFDFGYDVKLHGFYDYAVTNYDRSKQKIERIGKKYQWIAFHEIFSMITDNYKILKDWGSDKKYVFYPGAWKGYLRDVDPIFVTKIEEDDEDYFENDVEKEINTTEWFVDISYNHWDELDAHWVNNIQNLPDPKHIIQVQDPAKKEWLYLNLRTDWNEPKTVGDEMYTSDRKYFWYDIQGYFVKKRMKNKVVNWLKKKDLYGIDMPQSNRANSGLFNRENYWSPASQANRKEEEWQPLYGSNYEVLVATSEATGEFSNDYSGAHFQYDMPCKLLFENINLKYASIDGNFTNNKDEVIVTGINPKGVLIRKDVLLSFLHENNLEIVWTLTGVKRASYIHPHYGKASYSKNIFGVYSLEEGSLKGSVTYKKDN